MDDYKPDVVVLRNLHGNYINLPMLLKYLAEKQIPTVITLHDFWFVTGKCVYFTSSGCEKWQDKCGNCSNLQSGNPTWFFDRTEEMLADKIKYFSKINKLALIGVSDWVTREAKKSPVAKSAVLVKRIYNWIDLNKFRPCNTEQLRKSRGLEDKFVILGVSSVWTKKSVVDKGLRSFIKLAKMLPENYRIVLVGKMDADVSLPENIISVGKTDSVEELAQYYSMADVFVTFSAEETFGKVSAEALACGTPIVCYNSTANPELVGNGCGAVLPLGDIEGIYSEIRKIALNGKANYSEACRTFAKESFDKEKNLNQYFELFKWLTEK